MHFQYTPFVIPLVIAAAISGWMAYYTWMRRSMPGATALSVLAMAIAGWSLGYALEIAGADLATKMIWGKIQYAGIVIVPLLWFIFAFNHTKQDRRLNVGGMLLMAIVPLITFLLVVTNEWHGLIWAETSIIRAGALTVLGVSYGFWFWAHSLYSYALLLGGAVIIMRSLGRLQGLYRGQSIALIIGVIAPWLGNALYLLNLSPIPNLDLTPFAFTITVVALTWGIFGFRLIDLSPVAREIVVEEMRDGMIVIDMQGRVADINPAARKLLDRNANQMIGQMARDVFHQWPHLTELYRDQMDTQEEITIGDGEAQRWFELRLAPLYDRRRRPLGRVIILRNITARRRAEEQLRQLSRAVEASPTSIVITDTEGRIQYVNSKFTEVTGYGLEEVLGENPRILKTDQTPAGTHEELWKNLASGREWRGEFCNRKKSGEIFWESASISPIIDSSGKTASYVAVKEDITDRKRAEQELAIARDLALEASRAKSQLLAKVSHELRTPLGGILGYAELLETDAFGPLDDSQKNATAQIIDSARYLAIMVNELLDEAQIESKTVTLRRDVISLADILEKVEISMAVLARHKGLEFTTHIAADMPETLVGDSHRLQQILINLVGNAIKFTPSGEVRVNIFLPDLKHWALEVSDTGGGIPEDAHTYIFEPFRQVDNAITRENRGTGLGLSITKSLVEMMGGRIHLKSELGKGSTFTVLLPLILPPQ